jgi:CheY-like chemotaxis protein
MLMQKILVVDDSLFQRRNICSVLVAAGFEIIEAENGREGLEKVTADSPDFIMTDLLMPEMDGMQFLSALKEKNNTVPVFVLTSDIQDNKRVKCLELGAAGFLSKPLRKAELLEALHSKRFTGKES